MFNIPSSWNYSKVASEPWHVAVAPRIGRALALSHKQATVWQYKSSPSSSNQTQPIQIKLPYPTNSTRDPLPLGRLIPTSTEPSVLLVMPASGKIIFWESLSDAANPDSNRQRQQSIQGKVNGMMSGEIVTDITEAEPQGFVLTFNSGRLAHLTVNDSQGKQSMSIQYMRSEGSPNPGILGSLRGVFSSSGWKKNIAAVRAGPSVQRGQRYVITATTAGTFQVWDLHWSGTQALTYEVDLSDDLMTVSSRDAEDPEQAGDADFEVVNFSVTSRPYDASNKMSKKDISSFDIQILALIASTDSTSTRYTIVALKLSASESSIHFSRTIKTNRTRLHNMGSARPLIVVPEPRHAAIVAFEHSFTVVSLRSKEEDPSSQLQPVGEDIDTTYDETVQFQKQRSYKLVGCVPEPTEPRESSRTESSCTFAVHEFGLIRIKARPSQDAVLDISSTEAAAGNKLEQAVFFGDRGRNLIDFSPRDLDPFTIKDVERAALRLSHAIVASTSTYLPTVGRSMQDQLRRRAKALADLNKYIQLHFHSLSPETRWQLLWDAEKLASARALWRWYDAAPSDSEIGPKSFFAEMIEAIPESLKIENQRDQGETDIVRHWFFHDAWRIEWVLPYSHEIIELLFRESVDEKREMDTVAKAMMISSAVDIQLLTLETAFKFRESNMVAYGFQEDHLTEGILEDVSDFKGLDEFWTSSSLQRSSALIPERVRELADLSREMAKLLASELEEFLEQQEPGADVEDMQLDIDPDRTHSVMTALAKKCPRLVAACCQVFTERSRWLKSRSGVEEQKEGQELASYHALLRRKQIVELTELDLAEQGVELAERYRDMEALLDIFEQESTETNSIGPSIPGRIRQYFARFGTDWANAYFTRSFADGTSTVDVLSNNADYKSYLTKFLRSHPEYDRIAWINEISTERNYAKAASSLDHASRQCEDVWQQKAMLSLSKLSIQAAESRDQVQAECADQSVRAADIRLELLRIQESLYQFFEPYIDTAIDNDAAADVVLDHYGIHTVDDKPSLKERLRDYLQQLFSRQTLAPLRLIDLLTLLHDNEHGEKAEVITQRFFRALWIMKKSSSLMDLGVNSSLLSRIVWRRLLISSDWTSLNRTEAKNDTQVSEEIARTPLFQTLLIGFCNQSSTGNENFWDTFPLLASPTDVLDLDTTPEEIRTLPHFSDLSEEQLDGLSNDLSLENESLKRYLKEGRLEQWFKGIIDDARTAAERDVDGEDVVARRSSRSEQDGNGDADRSPGFNVHEDVDDSQQYDVVGSMDLV